MVRVDRLYLGPMSAPDQLGRDKLNPSWYWVVINFTHRGLGSELLPATAPVLPLFGGRRSGMFSESSINAIQTEPKVHNTRRTKTEKLFEYFRAQYNTRTKKLRVKKMPRTKKYRNYAMAGSKTIKSL
jgi:hypothetical protein